MLKTKTRPFVAMIGIAAIALTSACMDSSENNGSNDPNSAGGSNDPEFEEMSAEIESWEDMCDVFDPDDVTGRMSIAAYESGPGHSQLGTAANAEAISCLAEFSIDRRNHDSSFNGEISISVLPALTEEHRDEMHESRLNNWREEKVETIPENDLILDEEIQGDWNEGHAYAMGSIEQSNELIVNVKDDLFLVEIFMVVPRDHGYLDAIQQGHSPEDAEEYRDYDFVFTDLATFVAEDYINQAHAAVSEQLSS